MPETHTGWVSSFNHFFVKPIVVGRLSLVKSSVSKATSLSFIGTPSKSSKTGTV
jgi:hypothetical protein